MQVTASQSPNQKFQKQREPRFYIYKFQIYGLNFTTVHVLVILTYFRINFMNFIIHWYIKMILPEWFPQRLEILYS